MRRLVLTLAALAALAAPAAHADPIEDVIRLVTSVGVEDYCVVEEQEDGSRRKVVCVPAGDLPEGPEIRLDDLPI